MSTIAATNLKNPSAGSNNIVLGTDGSTRVTTLADSAGANTSTPAEIASGRAKAWVNFNGIGTVAIRAQYNVSSITDNGTGNYTVNFTNALSDSNYAFVFGNDNADRNCESLTLATGSFQLGVWTIETNTRADISVISVAFFR
jgi:hypothetical protein